MFGLIISKPQNLGKGTVTYIDAGVNAGFPSPAADFSEKNLDLNEFLIKHPAATFYIRVSGSSMIQAGLYDGDILVVDKAIEARNEDIVVAVLNGEFTVKRFSKTSNGIQLIPANPAFSKITVPPDADFQVWGVVIWVIHKAR